MGTFHDLPLIDQSIADQLFGDISDPESIEMQREIWQGIRGELDGDLKQLASLNGDELKSSLHRIRGYCSTTALSRLGGLLNEWEHTDYVDSSTPTYLPLALAFGQQSIAEIEQRYPHLVTAA